MTTTNAMRALASRRVAAPLGGAVALALLAMIGAGGPAASAREGAPSGRVATIAVTPTKPQRAQPALQVQSEPRLERFTRAVGPDLSESLRRAGVPAAAAREYVGQMIRAANLSEELSVADRFDLVLAIAPGKAPMLVYAGLDRVGRSDVQLLKWTDGRKTIWLDAAGLARDEGGISMPLNGRVTSGFGGRMHPILGEYRMHRGVDLAAPMGTPIRAAADGRVTSAGWHGGYGRLVTLAHGDGLQSEYGHMSRIVAQPGEMVRRGQLIGYVGSSGLSTGPHLHFEVRKGGRPINPMSARLSTPIALSGEQLHAFHDQLRYVLTLQRAGA